VPSPAPDTEEEEEEQELEDAELEVLAQQPTRLLLARILVMINGVQAEIRALRRSL
jgi:hypothetical protein